MSIFVPLSCKYSALFHCDCSQTMIITADISSFAVSPSSTKTVETRNDVMLQCVTGLSAPPASVQWYKDGNVVTYGNQQTVAFGLTQAGGAQQR